MNKILLLIALVTFTNAQAQKLPNVQTTSLRVPANVKIDGKATEWNNQFKAHNQATELSYIIANDDNNLYLILGTDDAFLGANIAFYGITIGINKSSRKDKDEISITYPFYDKKSLPALKLNKRDFAILTDKQQDSIIALNNNQLVSKSKLIVVKGIPNIDTISVYNTNGIKIVQSFTKKMAYAYELAINLKLIGLSAANHSNFTYHVTTNTFRNVDVVLNKDGSETRYELDGPPSTDFWGEYKLAK